MPLITVARFFFGVISLAVLAGAAYLLWSWADGDVVQSQTGELIRTRDDWRLWTGLALCLWSFAGRFVITPLLARSERTPPRFERAQGRTLTSANAVSLYVEEHGSKDAPTLIFTHGQGLDTTIWAYARRDLAKTFRLVFWDLPGLGRSKHASASDLNVGAAAQHLRAVIDANAQGPVVLVGHSFGGMTIQELAQSDQSFTQKVAGVVLLNTTLENPLKTMVLSKLAQALQKPVLEPMHKLTALIQPLAWLSNWQSYMSGFAHLANRLQFAGAVTRPQLEHTTLLSTRNPPGAIELRNVGMYHWRGLRPGSFGVPVLVIGGGKDIVTKASASEQIAADLKDAELLIMSEANHMGPIEFASDYHAAITKFALARFQAHTKAKIASAEAPQAPVET